MTDARTAAERIGEVIRQFAPGWPAPCAETAIGAGGLGLDSVALVELLVACEERFQLPFPDTLFAHAPLTVGRLVSHLENAECQRTGAL